MKNIDQFGQISFTQTYVKHSTRSVLSLLLFLFSSAVYAQTPAPSGLWVPSTSGTAINLSWTAPTDTGNNGALYGHNVNRCEGTDCTPVYHAWVPFADGTSYTDTGVTSGTTYRYSIVASWETGGLSASSNWEYATAESPPGPPTGLTVTSSSETAIGLSWTAPAGQTVRGYDVWRCVAPCTLGDGDFLAWVTQGAGDPAPAPTEYTDTDVTPGTTYRYVVFASVGDWLILRLPGPTR